LRESSFHLGAIDPAHPDATSRDERDDQQPCVRCRQGTDLPDVGVAISVAHVVQATVVDDQLEVRTDAGPAQLRDVGAQEVDGGTGRARLGTCAFEWLGHEVDRGDLPAVLGEIDGAVTGTAADLEGRPDGKRGGVARSLDQIPQALREGMTIPWSEPDAVKDPKQRVFGSHSSP
jgi:hypothetical protein